MYAKPLLDVVYEVGAGKVLGMEPSVAACFSYLYFIWVIYCLDLPATSPLTLGKRKVSGGDGAPTPLLLPADQGQLGFFFGGGQYQSLSTANAASSLPQATVLKRFSLPPSRHAICLRSPQAATGHANTAYLTFSSGARIYHPQSPGPHPSPCSMRQAVSWQRPLPAPDSFQLWTI